MRKTIRTALCAMLAIATAAVALSACNTVRGVGKDIGVAGDAVERAGRN